MSEENVELPEACEYFQSEYEAMIKKAKATLDRACAKDGALEIGFQSSE